MKHIIDFNLLKNINELKEKGLILKKKDDIFLVKYNKKYINNENISTLGKYRSIIFNDEKILSYSPPKSLRYNSNFNIDGLKITEFCDGTMINLFYYKDKWEIATKSVIGANCKYYVKQEKTYRDMFFEVIEKLNINLNIFNKSCSYSFILQHPENRIVSNIQYMNLILIKCYSFNDNIIMEEDITEYSKYMNISLDLTNIFKRDTLDEIFNNYLNFTHNVKDYNKVGIVLTNSNGERIKIRNFYYEYVKRLKGNSPKLQFIFYSIKKLKKIKEFLTFFPEHSDDFKMYTKELYEFTGKLYNKYVSCFIKKEEKISNMNYEFKPHLFKLHKIYLDSLSDKKIKINKKIVIDYINNLEPEQLMFCINYKKRKKEQ